MGGSSSSSFVSVEPLVDVPAKSLFDVPATGSFGRLPKLNPELVDAVGLLLAEPKPKLKPVLAVAVEEDEAEPNEKELVAAAELVPDDDGAKQGIWNVDDLLSVLELGSGAEEPKLILGGASGVVADELEAALENVKSGVVIFSGEAVLVGVSTGAGLSKDFRILA